MQASLRGLGCRFCGNALAIVLKLFPLTTIPAGLCIMAKYSSSNSTFSLKTNCFRGVFSSGMVSVMLSPSLINVAVVAVTLLTVISFFFKAFFRADLVSAAVKIPTP